MQKFYYKRQINFTVTFLLSVCFYKNVCVFHQIFIKWRFALSAASLHIQDGVIIANQKRTLLMFVCHIHLNFLCTSYLLLI